ncbi:MAG: hypothetical protein WDO16_17020 [Bacteroidota bacterium]
MNASGADRTFTNLLVATTYYFRVYDFDIDAAGNTYYLTSSLFSKQQSYGCCPNRTGRQCSL